MNSSNGIVVAAGLFGLTGVALGAFGAHALKETLVAHGSTETWKTAVLYHLIHAVALLALVGVRGSLNISGGPIAWCWSAGIVFFSGSLYWLALGGPKLLGPVTPLGGLALISGWGLLIWQAWKGARP